MNTAGIRARLGLRFLTVAALLVGLVLTANEAIARLAPAHPDSMAALFGAAATIFAGYLAWESIFFKARLEQAEKEARAKARKEDLVLAITQPVHAASALAAVIVIELDRPGDIGGQSARVKRRANHLHQLLNPQILFPLMDELSANDRNALLMMIGQMQAVIAKAELGTDIVLTDDDLSDMKKVFVGLHRLIVLFDIRLANGFAEDSRLELPVGDTPLQVLEALERLKKAAPVAE